MIRFSSKPSLSRDFLLLSVVILFFLSLAAMLVALRIYDEHSKEVISHLENESLRIDRALIVEIENRSYLLESLGRQISQTGPENTAEIVKLLRSFNDQGHRQDILTWIAPDQMAIASSNRGELGKPIDVSDRDYIKKALAEPWKIQIGRPIQGRVSEKWVLPICIGLTDYRGNHVGALVASLDINDLTASLHKVIRETGIDFAIYSNTLNPLTESSDNTIFSNNDRVQERLSHIDFHEHPSGVLSQATISQPHDAYSFYELSTQYPYVILISYDQVASSRQINASLLKLLLNIGLLALLIVAMLWLIRTRIIHPVENLSEIVADIARGKKYRPMRKTGPAEIEQLAGRIRMIDEYIEERRRKENELVQKNGFLLQVKDTAQRMIKARLEFLHTLSAELSRPLHIIEADIQSMRDQHSGPLGSPRYIEQVSEIDHKVRQMRQMVDDIASINNNEYGVLVLHERPIDVSFSIHRAVRQFTDMPPYKHVDVKLRLDEQLPKLLIDEEKLNQILLHMLTSAVLRAANGSGFIMETMLDKNQQNEDEFVIMLKYTLRINDAETAPNEGARAPDTEPLQLRSDGISLALTRMLLTLQHGHLETSTANNHVCRIFLRFPASRIVTGRTSALA